MNYYFEALKKYGDFEGRARRAEYWIYHLINWFVILFLAIFASSNPLGGVILTLYGLFQVIPTLAVQIRRLHDVEKSGWFVFVPIIPVVGSFWLFTLMVTEGTRGVNFYGHNPKDIVSY